MDLLISSKEIVASLLRRSPERWLIAVDHTYQTNVEKFPLLMFGRTTVAVAVAVAWSGPRREVVSGGKSTGKFIYKSVFNTAPFFCFKICNIFLLFL